MTDLLRSSHPFRIILLLSGWVVALALGLKLSQPEPVRPHPSAAAPRPQAPMQRIFSEWASQPEFAGALIAFCLLDEKGEPVFISPLASSALCPASALKTVTTGAAFGLLGPDFRFETRLESESPVEGGVLGGDLVLSGSGDPTLTIADLETLAQAAVKAGLREVTGGVRVVSELPSNPVSDHWNWGDIGNGYGAGAYGLNIERNRCKVWFKPAREPGEPAPFMRSIPALRQTRWNHYVTTGPAGSGDGVVVYSEPYGRTITTRGTVPAGEESFSVSAAIPDPPALAAELLQSALESRGVVVRQKFGPYRAIGKTKFATHLSGPLAEIIDHLHRVSDNLEAQSIFLAIGHRHHADAAIAVREYWERAGVSFVGLRLIDGSGLARANMIRPLDLARVNFTARHGPHGQRFYESLSTYNDGNVRGKVGGMSGVLTQVGFIRTERGGELTFAVMANGLSPATDFWRKLGELIDTVRTLEL